MSDGRAFCAGGDVVRMYNAYINNDYNYLRNFLRDEFTMDYRFATLKVIFKDSNIKLAYGMEQ